jgi:hypothetical protein
MNDLIGMTQTRWDALSNAERERLRDLSGLTPELVGLEGWRVEAIDPNGEKRRFIVGRSTGWRPCHLEIANVRSSGGIPACRSYKSVRKIRKDR